MIRHGELLIVPSEIPSGGEVSEHGSFIAGHSETGHHHVLAVKKGSKIKVHKFTEQLFVDLVKDAQLRHNKTGSDAHDTVTVPAGRYEIRRKKEYDFRSKAMRSVWD